ncbi:hypothetical protein PHLGIDRAFT_122070 [Phlebiopsis gigantea 11061_1 CR5-6]|uniref:Secreted protein n=1 Tax=Phlebiopsis gigantea (strain 11061_1 CR5-6) TaxID=745531 RepID=A0A0C3S4B8_PHLG1|nr:hypothetical protein PHLGIDRAFT_122070 [Phlebiopsis gigantea 11061_1 CR5-6]
MPPNHMRILMITVWVIWLTYYKPSNLTQNARLVTTPSTNKPPNRPLIVTMRQTFRHFGIFMGCDQEGHIQ